MPKHALNDALCVCRNCMLRLVFASYLCSEVDGEDGGGWGGPVGGVMMVMMRPLFLLSSEQILVAQRNTAVVLTRQPK